MSIAFNCQGCGSRFKGKDELQGKRVKCAKCGTTFAVVAAVPSSNTDTDSPPCVTERPQGTAAPSQRYEKAPDRTSRAAPPNDALPVSASTGPMVWLLRGVSDTLRHGHELLLVAIGVAYIGMVVSLIPIAGPVIAGGLVPAVCWRSALVIAKGERLNFGQFRGLGYNAIVSCWVLSGMAALAVADLVLVFMVEFFKTQIKDNDTFVSVFLSGVGLPKTLVLVALFVVLLFLGIRYVFSFPLALGPKQPFSTLLGGSALMLADRRSKGFAPVMIGYGLACMAAFGAVDVLLFLSFVPPGNASIVGLLCFALSTIPAGCFEVLVIIMPLAHAYVDLSQIPVDAELAGRKGRRLLLLFVGGNVAAVVLFLGVLIYKGLSALSSASNALSKYRIAP